MLYLLKFGASLVLPPGIFFVLFFVLAFFCWRRGERNTAKIIFAITAVFYILSTSVVAEWSMGYQESKYEPPIHPQGDIIIMLGGGATLDTPDVDGIGGLCSGPSSRLLAAVRLQKQLDVPILVSGGQVYADTGAEAEIAKRVLMSLGVPEASVFVEDRSLNTTQNALYSSRILREYGFTRPILVTSAFHMERAVGDFSRQGVEVTPFPTDYKVNRQPKFNYTKLRPQTEALLYNVMVLQEVLRTFVSRHFE